MTAFDTAKAVCAKASLCDPTFPKPDRAIAAQWAEILGDIDMADALDVVRRHYTQPTPDRIYPGDVVEGVRRIRAERIRAVPTSQLEPHDVDPDDIEAYNAAKRARIDAIASGRTVSKEPLPLSSRPVEQLMKTTAAQLPKIPPAKPRADLDKKRVPAPVDPSRAPEPVVGSESAS